MKVKPEIGTKRVIVTKMVAGRPTQDVVLLHKGMTDVDIRKAVQKGVDMSHFTGTEEELTHLERFKLKTDESSRMLNATPATETFLVGPDGMPYTGVAAQGSHLDVEAIKAQIKAEMQAENPAPSTQEVAPVVAKYELVKKGLSHEQAEKAYGMTEEELKADNFYQEVAKAFKMKGKATPERVFKALNE
jgi:hypothetical protein